MRKSAKKMKNVLVALEFYRGPLFEGIAQYACTHDWHLSLDMLPNPGNIPETWDGDGILTMLVHDDTPLLAFLARCDKPTVNVEGRRLGTDHPRVFTDTRLAVEMAHAHFKSKGFVHFAYYGYANSTRKMEYAKLLEENGAACAVLDENDGSWDKERGRIEAWLKDLPKPLAVFCWTDYAGARFMDAALAAGYDIPGDIAVLGMDNESLVCDCTAVRLSSIATPLFEVGFRGAAELDRLMAGKRASAPDQLIPPMGVVERGSTDTMAAPSPLLVKAITHMKAHFTRGLTVAEVAKAVGVSRRGLEKAFRQHLGCSPHERLVALRLEKAKELLRGTQEKVSVVGHRAGFKDPKHFGALFKRETGKTPRGWRKAGAI